MKIIVSHDVDHLYVWDHLKRDLIIEKLWVRSIGQFIKRNISGYTLMNRLIMPFRNRMHRIDEVMAFDEKHSIPSVFFFGVDNALGMSYKKKQAKPIIEKVLKCGFDVGVHGVEYKEYEKIRSEHDGFQRLSGLESFGIRNHYVRYDQDTFKKQADSGYLFDSTWFDKSGNIIKGPYKVNNMWEFPLHIMDVYECSEGKLKEGIDKTIRKIEEIEKKGIKYCTILFHDYQFDADFMPDMMEWYIKIIEFCEEKGYTFISYRDAIQEMEI